VFHGVKLIVNVGTVPSRRLARVESCAVAVGPSSTDIDDPGPIACWANRASADVGREPRDATRSEAHSCDGRGRAGRRRIEIATWFVPRLGGDGLVKRTNQVDIVREGRGALATIKFSWKRLRPTGLQRIGTAEDAAHALVFDGVAVATSRIEVSVSRHLAGPNRT